MGDAKDGDARCADWAARAECVINPRFMRNSCPRACGVTPDAPARAFELADVCRVTGGGTEGVNGNYRRAPGLQLDRVRLGHTFGKLPYMLFFQRPARSEPASHWSAFLFAPARNVSASAPYYFMRPERADVWEAGGSGASPAVGVRCWASGDDPPSADEDAVSALVTRARSAWGLAKIRQRVGIRQQGQPDFLGPATLDELEASFLRAVEQNPESDLALEHMERFHLDACDAAMLGWCGFQLDLTLTLTLTLNLTLTLTI